MPNHVHVLLLPRVPPSRLLKSLKGSTAREANRLLAGLGSHSGGANLTTAGVRDERSGTGLRLT